MPADSNHDLEQSVFDDQYNARIERGAISVIFKARHVVGLLMVLVLVSGCSFFGKKEVVPQVPEVLTSTGAAHVDAHIYRPFPEMENEEAVDEIVVEGRFRPGASSGSSWIAQLVVYWDTGEVVSIGTELGGVIRLTG